MGVAEAMMREAMELHRRNRVVEAIAAYQGIVARWPGQADSWFNLAVLQRQTRHMEEALYSYQRALDAGVSRPEEVHLNRSVIYTDFLRQHHLAERELRLALSLNPNYTPARLNLANLCEDLGRREEAHSLYGAILTRDPRCYEALARLANLKPRGVADETLAPRLSRAIADPSASAGERASLGFALGRLLDEAADYPAAFAAYVAANRASRQSAPHAAPYDRNHHAALVNRLIAAGSGPVAGGKASPPHPIFICGMFRSGSTLAEQLLLNCQGVAAGGELDFLPRLAAELAPFPESLSALTPQRLAELRARYASELARVAAGARHVIDKRPDNFLYIGLIKRLYPDAKIVHTVRNPLDNCLSIFFLHLDQSMSYALDLDDIAHYYRQYRRLMAHWQAQFPQDIFEFDYDTLVADPSPSFRRLVSFLGVSWDEGTALSAPPGGAVKTASVWQVREPLYRSSSGRARHYANELKGLRDALDKASE